MLIYSSPLIFIFLHILFMNILVATFPSFYFKNLYYDFAMSQKLSTWIICNLENLFLIWPKIANFIVWKYENTQLTNPIRVNVRVTLNTVFYVCEIQQWYCLHNRDFRNEKLVAFRMDLRVRKWKKKKKKKKKPNITHKKFRKIF